ncbi:Hypothetical_protein [Hexamita inflata]|uniref:Hypothetical_protein n=1 Tax=Hexamita inflata TaxID=28002 RepID=A0AA86TR66_9EUKA|nr:Hypothetical protein HINF_LOCUS12930 [Hexamita inflata]
MMIRYLDITARFKNSALFDNNTTVYIYVELYMAICFYTDSFRYCGLQCGWREVKVEKCHGLLCAIVYTKYTINNSFDSSIKLQNVNTYKNKLYMTYGTSNDQS